MTEPFFGEIKIISFNFPPKGWAFCNGQLLPIAQNQALFSLLGTTYGGNGQTNFALPDFRGLVPVHRDGNFTQGERGGEEAHTLITSELPQHMHYVGASTAAPDVGSAAGNLFAANAGAYASAPNAGMLASTGGNAGGSQAHNNMQPYLVLNFIIALTGIFPSRY